MRIPASFQVRYDEERVLIDQVRRYSERRLRTLCADNDWLFDDRVKEPESVLAKLQLGRLASLAAMDDFYAATVVVPSRADVDTAVNAIVGGFGTANVQRRTPERPEHFIYDDVHVIATLGRLGPLDPTGLLGVRAIEIQIHTGLQWSWWRVTHDQIYKGSAEWRLRRAAAELRAELNRADRGLGDLQAEASRIEGPARTEAEERMERLAAWLARWPKPLRAEDPRRFADTADLYLKAAGIDLDAAETMLDGNDGQQMIARSELTPAQAIAGLLIAAAGPPATAAIRRAGRYVLVTDEMAAVSTVLAGLPAGDRVQLRRP